MVNLPLGLLADAFIRLEEIALKERCEQSLMEFVRYLWDITDPGEPLVEGWAMEAICAHLEACYYGHIRRLLITVPPGFSKSSLCNVFFPLWVWIKEGQAHNRFIHASYEEGIPERDNHKCRNIIGSEKFQRFWGDRFKLVPPTTDGLFSNDHTGWKMATAVGAKLIGYRGNYLVIDDPNDPKVENVSGADRIRAVRWFRETVPTRLNNMRRDKIIVIQQRLHMEDIAGVALKLEHESYVHLNIPMEYEQRIYEIAGKKFKGYHMNVYLPADDDESDEPERIQTVFDQFADAALAADPDCVFWRDPRTDEGDLAWPERFGRREVVKLKKTMDATMASAQLQQRPVKRGGNTIRDEWWKTWDRDGYPTFDFILATLDTAYTEKTQNDPSGMIVWGLWHDEFRNPKIMLIYAWTDWLEFPDLVRRTLHVCSRNDINYGEDLNDKLSGHPRFPVDTLLIEGKASGMSVQQEIGRLISVGQARRLHVDMVPAQFLRDDKLARLTSVSHMFKSEMISCPNKDYADDVIDQVGSFPMHPHDEYVDCTSMGLKWFRDQGFAPTKEEIFEEESALVAYQPKQQPLYGGV